MDYYLIGLYNNTVYKIHPICGTKKEELLNQLGLIRIIEETVFYYPQMIRFNIEDFYALKKAENQYYSEIGIDGLYNSTDIQIDLNRRILNILTTFRAYTDKVVHMLNSQFGDKNKNSEYFLKLTNKYFDTYFEYRFMCKYRNYVQHVGLPIHDTMTLNTPTNPKVEFFPLLYSEKLLSDYKDGWGPVKKDLTKGLVINLYDLLKKFESIIIEMHIEFTNYIFVTNVYNFDILLNYIDTVNKNNRNYLPAILMPKPDKTFDIQIFPIKFINTYKEICITTAST